MVSQEKRDRDRQLQSRVGPSGAMTLTLGRTAVLLLLVAAAVAIMTRRLRLPYSAGLVAAGIGMALLPGAPQVTFTKNFVFGALLPPLLFEAAFHLNWEELRRDGAVIGALATLGVAICAAAVAAGMHYGAGWPWSGAAVFGALIAATDPVSVIATFQENRVRGRLRLLVEAESLFNDGTAAVAFAAVVAIAVGEPASAGGIAWNLAAAVGGAIAIGAAVAGAAMFLMGRTQDHLVELTFTTVAAYGSFLAAEEVGVSGVIATITAGIILGNWGACRVMTTHGNEAVEAFWEYAAFVANSLVFLLIGMREAAQNFRAAWAACVIAIIVVLAGRAAAVYPVCALFARSSRRVPASEQHVLFWGGLRGALALALALGLPKEMANREQMITACFAVVAFSVFVQGLTMPRVLRRANVLPAQGRAAG
jgi:CPA1 family monovalent cation:H+ antiporter